MQGATVRGARLDRILERLASAGSVSVAELSKEFGVSEPTVRRDLKLLEEQNLLARIHGGAHATDVLYELPYQFRDSRNEDEKRRIAAVAVGLVDDGTVVGLTAGTTTTWLARKLVGRPSVTIVTNALNIAYEMVVRPSVKVVLTGGITRGEHYELVGPLAEASLAGVNIGILFVGGGGISTHGGLATHDELAATVTRALIARSDRVIAVLDGSKVGQRPFAFVCDIATLDGLVTTADADPGETDRLEAAGLKVWLA